VNVRQQKFCDYYLQSGNATEAAKKAGYSEKTARAIGAENLTKLDIQKYLAEHAQRASNARIADANEVLEFWSNTMRNSELASKDRLKASELLGKVLLIDGQENADRDIHVTLSVEDMSGGEDGD
jgi:terminase small subunit